METQATVRELIDAIELGDSRDIQMNFNSIMAAKLSSAIEQRRIDLSDSIFNGGLDGKDSN